VLDDLANAGVSLRLARLKWPALQLIDLPEELVREHRHPWPELSLDVCLKNLLKFEAGSHFLISCGLIDQCDNAHSR
jgi:hypothetical protein